MSKLRARVIIRNRIIYTPGITEERELSLSEAVSSVSTWSNTNSAADQTWIGIEWSPELALFVAVASSGTGNRVMTSPDGINWTLRASAADNDWHNIVWSPQLGLFVTVATSGTTNRAMTSPDGINWTIRVTPNQSYDGVCWSPELGLFAASALSGTGNRIMTSPDGIIWTARVTPADNDWNGICWSPELALFCAVATTGTGNRVMTSPDGINWTLRNSAADNAWDSVCWSPELGLFCAVAYSGGTNRVMTSPDGINWTTRTTPNYSWDRVCWSPDLGMFAATAVGYIDSSGSGFRFMTSPDGIVWTARATPNDTNWCGICWSPELGVFAAVAFGGGDKVALSTPIPIKRAFSRLYGGRLAIGGGNTFFPNRIVSIHGDSTQTLTGMGRENTEKWAAGSEGASSDRFVVYNSSLAAYALIFDFATNHMSLPAYGAGMLVSDASGSVEARALYGSFNRNGVNESYTASAAAKVSLTTSAFTTGLTFDGVTNFRVTVPVAGKYRVTGSIWFSGGSLVSGDYIVVGIRKNGTQVRSGENSANGGLEGIASVSCVLNLAAGDYLELWGNAFNSTTILGASTGGTFLDINFIGP